MGKFTNGTIEVEAIRYSGWMTEEMKKFVGSSVETEQREGIPAIGTFIRLSNGDTKMPSKNDFVVKHGDEIIAVLDQYSFGKEWYPSGNVERPNGAKQKVFYTSRVIERVVHDDIDIDQFINIMKSEEPSAIWNSQYSEKVPCYTISEYKEDGVFIKAHSSSSDSSHVFKSWDTLYRALKISGLDSWHILATEKQ